MSGQQPQLGSITGNENTSIEMTDVVLRKRAGEVFSLHRYAGRWLVLRVVDEPGAVELPAIRQGFDAIALSVVAGETSHGLQSVLEGDSTVYDGGCWFKRSFPSLSWPATFVINPAGQLAAILNDDTYESFVRSLVGSGRGASSHGAIDLGDIGA